MLLAFDLQVVGEVEKGGGQARVGVGLGTVKLVENHAFERHISVLHDDVERVSIFVRGLLRSSPTVVRAARVGADIVI